MWKNIVIKYTQSVVSFIWRIFGLAYKCLLKIKVCEPYVIINIDGGICSQMHQYLLGYYIKTNGTHVLYDLTFFKFGKDINGSYARNFDLCDAFIDIEISKANFFIRNIYKENFYYEGRFPIEQDLSWEFFSAPIYAGGYYADSCLLYKDYERIFNINPLVLDNTNLAIYNSINEASVAVHVRRGDLANYNPAYGYPASKDYFRNSCLYFYKILNKPIFYFFSDEPDYIENEILPLLPSDLGYIIVRNGSEKGYFDLILMSKCSHHITSKGSLGKYASCLCPNHGTVIVLKDDIQLGPLQYNTTKRIIRI